MSIQEKLKYFEIITSLILYLNIQMITKYNLECCHIFATTLHILISFVGLPKSILGFVFLHFYVNYLLEIILNKNNIQ